LHKRKTRTPKEIKDFVDMGNFEVYYSNDDKLMSVGLKWGEGVALQRMGIKRKDQIRMLDWLEDHPRTVKKLLG